eukprot:CAMPEP_0202688932 /NCGR_PEP_ID=MMETSP1385-20130828/4314_1 /ASSEMBLY_ACC=CAM_ASM_000861 /TAXON_ID=933848 /ORGANISM="Elphidium margaritaceum" /LENGTH=483 /DNA_ID=CAMNT_0049343991 /DNA_START=49 /DNA_END=1500 /DNA_ORIENTATION=-
MTDQWTSLTKCPHPRFSNAVFLSADEFVVAPYNYDKQKADGILKYNVSTNKWSTLVKYPKNFQISNCTLSVDDNERKLYLLGVESMVYCVDLDTNKFHKLPKGDLEVGVNASSLFIDGRLHILGGSRCRQHFVRKIYTEETGGSASSGDDDEDKKTAADYEFRAVFEFEEWAKGVQNCALIYVRSRHQLILMGGYHQYCEHQYADIVWTYDLSVAKKHRKWVKRCKMPERACYFGYALTSDERYVIAMGGYSTARKQIKKTYVLDVESMKFVKSTNVSSPASGSVRGTIDDDNNIYLFKHDNGALWKINASKLIQRSVHADDDNYANALVRKYKKLLKAAEMENRQLKIQLSKQKQVNEQLVTQKRRSKTDNKAVEAASADSKKALKRVSELEQATQEQQTEIRRLEEKVNKQERYINELEGEKMMVKNTSLQQKLKIRELKSRLGELEDDADQLDSIESFLAKQAQLSKQQDLALQEAGVIN